MNMEKHSHHWIKDIVENETAKDCYLVKQKRLGTTRKGEAFISLTLADRTGEIEGRVWERAEQFSSIFHEGDIIEVEGHAGSYRGQIQITISDLKATKGKIDPSIFIESSPKDISEMMKSLRAIIRGVKDVHLKALNDRFLSDRQFVSLFRKVPAAKNFHHSYLGGLLEHTLSVCQVARQVAEHYPHLDRDLLLTAAFLHDIGKMRELKFDLKIDYTDEGRLVGHVVMSTIMVDERLREVKDFPQELAIRLKHLILSHHGNYEFGSPKRPKFLEAFALHMIDDLDAKINGLGRFMERDRKEGGWTDFNQMFERYFLKSKILPKEDKSEDSKGIDEMQGVLFTS